MRLLAAFIAHEARTQFRSLRFRIVSAVYIVAGVAPAVLFRVLAPRLEYEIDSARYASEIVGLLPLLTTLMAAVLAVDAITREHEEGSFLVVALTPISSAGYFVRRWVAVVAVALPITIVPLILGAAIAAESQKKWPLWEHFAWGWLLHGFPVLLVASALFMAMGTITGRTILAIVAVVLLFTIGLELANSALARRHRHVDRPEEFFFSDILLELRRPRWSSRRLPENPTAAAYRRGAEVDALLGRIPLAAGVTFFLFAIAPAFLRRGRADLRPWRIRSDHPMRTFLRMLNRIREEFAPDPRVRSWPDRALFVICIVLGTTAILYLIHRQKGFERLAAAQFESESAIEPRPMSQSMVPVSLRLEGAVRRSMDLRAALVMRNEGTQPDSHLAFELNPGLAIDRIAVPGRQVRVTRRWDRVGLDVRPPIAPGQTCEIEWQLRGTPGAYRFSLKGDRQSFGQKYGRYQRASEPGELSDLSRSTFVPVVDETGMVVRGSDFLPSPRYSPWTVDDQPVNRFETQTSSHYLAETRMTPVPIAVALKTPQLTAADSCASLGDGVLESRCTMPIAEYTVAGARVTSFQLADGAAFSYLPRHAERARAQAESLREAIEVAHRAWPGLGSTGRVAFLERPTRPGEYYYGHHPLAAIDSIESSGTLHLLPELMIIQRKLISANAFAAGIITNSLKRRRRIVSEQQHLVETLITILARSRVARRTSKATVAGPNAYRSGLLETVSWSRLDKVFAEIEYRVGTDALIGGINDFLNGGPHAGTARELIDAIAKRGGVSLDRMYTDYFEGNALPKLTLTDVVFRRTVAAWEISGTLRNLGTGESFCPVVLRTRFGSMRKVVRIDSGEAVPFSFTSSHLPQAVQLDPEGVCYRAQIGTIDLVPYEGGA